MSPPLLAALSSYPFPGNVRELENIIERALALRGGDVLTIEDLGLEVDDARSPDAGVATGSLQDHLDQVERQAILSALEESRGNRTAAAKLLGITFRSMRYRMARLSIGDALT